jgi:hypothetical protein
MRSDRVNHREAYAPPADGSSGDAALLALVRVLARAAARAHAATPPLTKTDDEPRPAAHEA